jgi:hypothetical protein
MSFKNYINKINETQDIIPGGLADGLTIKDIASKHGVSLSIILDELLKGIQIELEHTSDSKIAKEIAMDHIFEDPTYYEKLAKIEQHNEEYEVFDELEILDERKFEKVKLARNFLSKMGYPNAYDRNEMGKYIMRSRDIKKLMRELGYVFNSEKGRWIDAPDNKEAPKVHQSPLATTDYTTDTSDEMEEKADPKASIIWVGHANPWHKSLHEVLKHGLSLIDSVNASKFVIMLVKDDVEEGLDFYQQLDLIKKIYEPYEFVDVCSVPVPTGSIVDIFAVAANKNIKIKGWITANKNIQAYKKQFSDFKQNKYKESFEQKTNVGKEYPYDNNIIFIDINTANIKSHITGKEARKLSKELSFDEWFKKVCPDVFISKEHVKVAYQEAYNILKAK